jgi:putative heme-binding domain-containing protein
VRVIQTVCVLSLVVASFLQSASAEDGPKKKPFGLATRTPLTTSNVRGRPEPPLPFRAEVAFPKVNFKNPTVLTNAPGTDRFFVAEQAGKIYSIAGDRSASKPDLFVDVAKLVEQLNGTLDDADKVQGTTTYGLTFHPDFAKNRLCYVCYVVDFVDAKRRPHPHGTRVVQFKVTEDDPPQAIVDSQTEIITWLAGGHNGGCIKFGLDGMLYVSTGDGGFAFPPDGRNSGQDVSTLLSAVLRIDVDRPENGLAYRIPEDNPFTDLKAARGEIWAYGMRNPWKISFDRKTGDLWVGDVGWELWELVYRVKPGDNYGWSLVEGPQPVHSERQRGPTPIVPPVALVPHTDGASITGGFVYRGKQFPELDGTYIFGDWETRRIWGVKPGEPSQKIGQPNELIDPTVRIVGFSEDNAGEIYLLDYDSGSIQELVRNEPEKNPHVFPRTLSETGLFDSVSDHAIAPGVVPFSINAEMWADHATTERFLAVPGEGSIRFRPKATKVAGSMFSRTMDYPKDSVLLKTLSLEMVAGDPKTKKRIETQLLHYDGREWRGYSYEWNKAGTDATLVDGRGKSRQFEVLDEAVPGGKREQTWRFSSRTECIRCHNPWAEHTLAFNIPQINREHDYDGRIDNQIRSLRHAGILEDDFGADLTGLLAQFQKVEPPQKLPALADPLDKAARLTDRGRAYLHSNCAHCHRFNGGGSARIYVGFDMPLSKMEAVDTRPTQGTFGIHDAKIIAPGEPFRSVLYMRVAKSGSGHMPHLGSRMIDRHGTELIHDWIKHIPVKYLLAEKVDELIDLDEETVRKAEAARNPLTLMETAIRLATANQRSLPSKKDHDAAIETATLESDARVRSRAGRRTKLLNELLATPRGAMLLARSVQQGRLPGSTRQHALAAATKHGDLTTRDLFESFLPPDQRVKRLGDSINAAEILKLSGDVKTGRDLFASSNSVQCRSCHKIGEVGKELGPDLSHVGKKLDQPKLLTSILEPSKEIDPKFQSWLVETKAGKVFTGLLVRKDDKEVVIRDAKLKELSFKASDLEGVFPLRKSLMPELLLRDMTAKQVADLIAYLESLK